MQQNWKIKGLPCSLVRWGWPALLICDYQIPESVNPSFILKQWNRVPWLVPLTVYPSCLANSPGRLGPLGHRITGFLIAPLLQQQTAPAQARRKHNSPVKTQHSCLQWIKAPDHKWKSTAEHSSRELTSIANIYRNKGVLTGQWLLEFRPKGAHFLCHTAKLCL